MSRNLLGVSFSLCAGFAVVSCAHIDYVKVPTPTQYTTWTDKDQRKADGMDGVRYYLPRPFVHLKKTIPVAQRVAFISFTYANGVYQLDTPENPPEWLKRVAPARLSITQALAASLAAIQPEGGRGEGGLQSATPGAAAPPPKEAPPTELTARTGYVNDTDPVTSLSDLMDVVYLPDFEEQYIIEPHGLLGKADIETKLRNGWAAEVFAQQFDNSNLIPYVIKQVERASEAAAGIAATWFPASAPAKIGLDQVKKIAKDRQGFQSGSPLESTDVQKVLGNVILFKIAEVKFAQPGLYPILKPREIRQWLKSDAVIPLNVDADAKLEQFIASSKTPWIRPDMAFVPCPPFTVVGFNVTTDVFLLPATERVAPEAQSAAPDDATAGPNPAATKAHLGTIRSKLVGAFSSFPQKDQTSAQLIEPDSGPDPALTRITIGPQPGKSFVTDDSAKAAVKEWIQATLHAKPEEVTVNFEGGKMMIVIQAAASDLATRTGTP